LFSEDTVSGREYLDMLEQFLYAQIADLQPNIIFQQAGAPPTLGSGCGRPIRWSPHSPDLTPLDFFLWGYVKDRVFMTPVNDLPDLWAHIREMIATVPMDI
jgi:hypothetical protein